MSARSMMEAVVAMAWTDNPDVARDALRWFERTEEKTVCYDMPLLRELRWALDDLMAGRGVNMDAMRIALGIRTTGVEKERASKCAESDKPHL